MPYFFRKLVKMSQNLSPAEVVIGALRVKVGIEPFIKCIPSADSIRSVVSDMQRYAHRVQVSCLVKACPQNVLLG